MDNHHSQAQLESTLSLLLGRVHQLEILVQGLIQYTNYSPSSKFQEQSSCSSSVWNNFDENRTCITEPRQILPDNDDNSIDNRTRKRRKVHKNGDTFHNENGADESFPFNQDKQEDEVVEEVEVDIKNEFVISSHDQEEEEIDGQGDVFDDENTDLKITNMMDYSYYSPQQQEEVETIQFQDEQEQHFPQTLSCTHTSDEDTSSLIQVVQSIKGNPSLIYKGYTYLLEKSVVNKKIFRCKFHKRCKCPARLHTNEFDQDGKTPEILTENGPHTHNLDGDLFGVEKPQRSKSNPEDNSHLLQVTHTAKGNPSIIYKSHTFLLEKVFVDKISFRCRHHKRKCSARLYTSDFVKDNCPPRLLAENGSHNHAYVVLPSYLRHNQEEEQETLIQNEGSSSSSVSDRNMTESLLPPGPGHHLALQLTKTRQGKSAILYKGHSYRFLQYGAGSKQIWACQRDRKLKCPARLHTNDFERDHGPPKLLLEIGTHTHHDVVENSTKTLDNEQRNEDNEQDPLLLLGI